MVRCTTSRGLLCIQSFPKATVDARLRLYKMILMVEELVEQVPFILNIYDIVEDKGAMLLCTEFCPRGTLCDALNDVGRISNMGWLVCEVLFLTGVMPEWHLSYAKVIIRAQPQTWCRPSSP